MPWILFVCCSVFVSVSGTFILYVFHCVHSSSVSSKLVKFLLLYLVLLLCICFGMWSHVTCICMIVLQYCSQSQWCCYRSTWCGIAIFVMRHWTSSSQILEERGRHGHRSDTLSGSCMGSGGGKSRSIGTCVSTANAWSPHAWHANTKQEYQEHHHQSLRCQKHHQHHHRGGKYQQHRSLSLRSQTKKEKQKSLWFE